MFIIILSLFLSIYTIFDPLKLLIFLLIVKISKL